jgi:hypothetical protein
LIVRKTEFDSTDSMLKSGIPICCILTLLSGCAQWNRQQATNTKLKMAPAQPSASERTKRCEKLMDEMAATTNAITKLPAGEKSDTASVAARSISK